MFDAHVYAYYRAPYRMVMLSRWPPWQTGKWVNPARICGEERPAYTHFLCRLSTFNFFLFLFYPSNFFTVISICARPPLLFLILNYRTTNIHLNVILFFFFFFLKFASHRIHPILLADFALAKIYELFRFTKMFENAICDMPVGKHCVSTNYSVRKKLHARLHGINLAAIDVLLVTIPEDIPFPRMGPRVWRRSISYLCAA